jgi:hypothetical protein
VLDAARTGIRAALVSAGARRASDAAGMGGRQTPRDAVARTLGAIEIFSASEIAFI